jgi:polyisoprenoid-binding protein YceI
MKNKIIIAIGFLVMGYSSFSQKYIPVDKGSTVQFSIKNFGINVTGSLSGLKGTIFYKPDNPIASYFDVNVNANTINTSNSKRDNHLRKEEYFNVAQFGTIRFVSSKITVSADGEKIVEGLLIIKGISKMISFPFTVATQLDGSLLLKGSFQINRRDFKVGSASLILSDNLTVQLQIVALKG